jgi:hypothetical protein
MPTARAAKRAHLEHSLERYSRLLANETVAR